MSAGDHYLSYKASYAHVQRAHDPISRCGQQAMAKYAVFVTLVAGAERFEVYTETSFSPISRYSFVLQVAQGPRSPKLAIFVRTTTTTIMTTTTDIQTDCFTPCACVQGKKARLLKQVNSTIARVLFIYMHSYTCTCTCTCS